MQDTLPENTAGYPELDTFAADVRHFLDTQQITGTTPVQIYAFSLTPAEPMRHFKQCRFYQGNFERKSYAGPGTLSEDLESPIQEVIATIMEETGKTAAEAIRHIKARFEA